MIRFKLFLVLVLMLTVLCPAISFGASYPASCPTEAQGILNALGGCSAVDCSAYGAICSKCGCSSKSQGSVSTAKKQTPSVLANAKTQTSVSSSTANYEPSVAVSFAIVIVSLVLGLVFWGAVWYVIWSLLKKTKPERWVHRHSVLMSIILTIVFILAIFAVFGLISLSVVTH